MAATHLPARDQGATRAAPSGWPLFVTVYLGIAGTLNALWGIAAATEASQFVQGGLVVEGLQTWGWIAIATGVLQLLGAGLVANRVAAGAMLAGWLAFMGLLVNFLAIGAYPLWSAILIALNALILWAVTVHSPEMLD